MQTYNTLYKSKKDLHAWLESIDFSHTSSTLVQLFSGVDDEPLLQEICAFLQGKIPNLTIIGTSTAGEILEGVMHEQTITIALSCFEKATLASCMFYDLDSTLLGQKVAQTILSQKTKAVIIFADGLTCKGEELLRGFTNVATQEVLIAGGMAGDNGNFIKTFVIHNGVIKQNGVVGVALNGDDLLVYNNYNLSWRAIGMPMKVTKADKNHIIEINNRPSIEIYRDYLGEAIVQNLPESAIEFPLIFEKNGVQVARVILGVDGESVFFAGEIPEGTDVYFGVASATEFNKSIKETYIECAKDPIQSFFIYSCIARKKFLGKELELEFKPLCNIAPVSGFFTYGELYYGDHGYEMLNMTTTILGVSESPCVKPVAPFPAQEKSVSLSTSALIHFVEKTITQLQAESQAKMDSLTILSQYKKAMDHSYIISQTDPKGVITDANELFCKISGYTKEELIGKPHNMVRHPDMSDEAFKDLWQTIQAKKIWRGIVQNRHKLGFSYYVDATIFALLDEHGTITGYVGIRDDVTELVQAKEDALAAERAKSAFLSTMSHELRTPLNAVIGFSQILMTKNEMPFETMKSFIEKINLAGKHLLSLVNNILDFSKIESGKMELNKKTVDLDHLTKEAIILVETAANSKNIEIKKENFANQTVLADEQLLKQVLLNLLSNAIKFTPSNKRITLTCKENTTAMLIFVCDEGVGLDEKQQAQLFQPFSQVKEHQNEAIKGTGLGLAISKKIIELHNGTIEVQSKLGEGSCFCISLAKEKK